MIYKLQKNLKLPVLMMLKLYQLTYITTQCKNEGRYGKQCFSIIFIISTVIYTQIFPRVIGAMNPLIDDSIICRP